MDLEIALETAVVRQPGRVDRLDLGEMDAIGCQLGLDGFTRAVAQSVVVHVDAHERRRPGMVLEEPAESGLDEVVELVVERAVRTGGGTSEREVWAGRVGHELLQGSARGVGRRR